MAKVPLEPKQTYRLAAISPVGGLPEDKLVLYRLTGTEKLGCIPEFCAEVHSDLNLSEVDGASLLGENVTVRLDLPDDEVRYFNGYITRFEASGYLADHELYVYNIIFRPWLWFLTRTANCRIFQEKSVDQIILEIFQDYGFSALVENKLTVSYPPLEYCVQYRETALDFVDRLMQAWGIYYFFKYENGKNTMVLVDALASHQSAPGYEKLPYYPKSANVRERDHIYQMHQASQVQPGSYVHTVYDFTKPKQSMEAKKDDPKEHALAESEVFDYPGEHLKAQNISTEDGATLAAVRHEANIAEHQTYQGEGNARGLCVGCTLNLEHDPMEKSDYLITAIQHEAHNARYSTSNEHPSEEHYKAKFSAILKDVQFRTPATTSKPVVRGPQTAIVCGKAGEEIDTDEYGRVKVMFHWDRFSSADEKSSCWIRVAQNSAGKKWGTMFIPRIGHEVIVDFLEGDPEQPIITGSVYNAETKPPFDLPANKTISGFKTNSSKGGEGSSEITIDDNKGKEKIVIHGEKDLDMRIEDTSREWIGNERQLVVKQKQKEKVEGEKHLIIVGGEGGDGNLYEDIATDKHQTIGKNFNLHVGETQSIEATEDIHIKAGSNYALEATSNVHIKAASQEVVIDGGSKITLQVGGSFVAIHPGGIDIQGPMVKLNSGGSPGTGIGAQPDPPVLPKEPTEFESTPGETASISATAEKIKASVLNQVTVQKKQAAALLSAATAGAPFCEKCEAAKQEQQQPQTTQPQQQQPTQPQQPQA